MYKTFHVFSEIVEGSQILSPSYTELYPLPNSYVEVLNLFPQTVTIFRDRVFFLINWRLITLQYCSGFCHTITWISHGCTCVSHPKPPSNLPPHPIPQVHPSAPALSTLSHASNLDWRSISHVVIYLFQCYSLQSSHPRLLPESKSLLFTSLTLLLSRI